MGVRSPTQERSRGSGTIETTNFDEACFPLHPENKRYYTVTQIAVSDALGHNNFLVKSQSSVQR